MTVAFREDVDRMTIGELRKYVGDLELRLSTLSASGTNGVENLVAALGLSKQEATLLAELSDGRLHSKESLLNAVSWRDDTPPEIKIIDVLVCKIRKKTGGSGIEIGTAWGVGYQAINHQAIQAVMRGEPLPPFDPVVNEQRRGRLKNTYGVRHGAVRDAVLTWLRNQEQDNKGRIVFMGRDLIAAVPAAQSASNAVRNLERVGHLDVVRAGRARKGAGTPWTVRLK